MISHETNLENAGKPARAPGVILITGNSVGTVFWAAMSFFALVLGGSPAPGYDRTTPMSYALIIVLGLVGAITGIAAGVRSVRGKNMLVQGIAAAALGAVGSIPLFLLELPAVGIIGLALGVVPAAVCLIFGRK